MPIERLRPARYLQGGIMGAALQVYEWAGSSLGDPDSWSTVLQLTTSLLLNSGQPMFIAYGPRRILIYNDAYIPLLGPKHPGALGRPFFDVWPEAQAQVEPLLDRVLAGERIDMDDIALDLDRGGIKKAHSRFHTPHCGTINGMSPVYFAYAARPRRQLRQRSSLSVTSLG